MKTLKFCKNITRRFTTSTSRFSDKYTNLNDQVGSNLPFGIKNRRLLCLGMTIYFGVPFALPFYVLRHHMLRANT
ncbi:unnamed protein product [Gordionus sp. m RMFG-2023]